MSSAQERKDSTVVLGEVVVVDSLGEMAHDVTLSESRLSPLRLALRSGETIADLLAAESFLYVRRAGPTGAATASLRGAGAEHTQIVLDGMHLTDPQSGQIDLTSIPASFIESIAVGHGGGYSTSAKSLLGGTVALQTLRPRPYPFYRVSASAGAFGRKQIGLAFSRPIAGLASLIAVDGASYEGLFPFTRPGAEDEIVTRDGADRNAANLYGRIEGDVGSGSWYTSAWLSSVDRGIPGPSNAPPVSARQEDRMLRIWTGHRTPIPNGSLRTTAAFTRSMLKYQSPSSQAPTLSRTQTVEVNSTASHVFSASWWADLSGAVKFEQSDLREGVRRVSGRLRASGTRNTGILTIHPALGMESVGAGKGRQIGILPSLSVAVVPLSSPSVSVRASAARILRVPTFNDRFWLPGGNPDLKPEFGWSADSGVRGSVNGRLLNVAFETTLFWSLLSDKIVWHPTFSGSSIQTWSPDNVGQVLGKGIESTIAVGLQSNGSFRLSMKALHTYARIEDRSDADTRSYGRQLRYNPEHTIKALLSTDAGAYGIDVILDFTGVQYITSDETQVLDPNVDLSVRLRAGHSLPGGTLRLQLGIENAADSRLATMRFYPMPPRHVTLSIVFETNQKQNSDEP